MRIEPNQLRPVRLTKDELEVTTSTRVKAAKPVQPRTLTPMVVQHPTGPVPGLEERQEKRHDLHVNGERRTYCRRYKQQTILTELRSVIDRRLHKQRKNDEAEHVNEEA